MCGLAGIIIGRQPRSPEERERIRHLAGRLLVVSERRGPHATGVALVQADGTCRIHKGPLPAHRFVASRAYTALLEGVGEDTTMLLLHTRWATRGTPQRNSNNHPLRCGPIVGMHNGTITNCDDLFARFGLRRGAEVDSEILLRFAERNVTAEGIDTMGWLEDLSLCQGDMAVVAVSLTHPDQILLVRGDRPLVLGYEPECGVMAFASERRILEVAVTRGMRWQTCEISPFTLVRLRCSQLPKGEIHAFPAVVRALEENNDGR